MSNFTVAQTYNQRSPFLASTWPILHEKENVEHYVHKILQKAASQDEGTGKPLTGLEFTLKRIQIGKLKWKLSFTSQLKEPARDFKAEMESISCSMNHLSQKAVLPSLANTGLPA